MLHSQNLDDEIGGCVVLNVNKLASERILERGDFRGELVANGGPSLATTRIRFETRWTGDSGVTLRIQFVVAATPALPRGEPQSGIPPFTRGEQPQLPPFTRGEHKGGSRHCEQLIEIVVERESDGAASYWMKCPLIQGGVVCSKRSGKLYLPSGSDRFGCRHCHGLFYST